MYPFFRMFKELVKYRNAGPLAVRELHISHHRCWPWDLDFWMELNNGRTLTLYDLGRIPLAKRLGLIQALKENRWGLTVAGVSIRYRRRVRAFDRLELRSRVIGWDHRFFYLEQGMWNGGKCTSHALYRTAVTDKNGIVNPQRVADAMGVDGASPELPIWAQEWIKAENHRPWPPEM